MKIIALSLLLAVVLAWILSTLVVEFLARLARSLSKNRRRTRSAVKMFGRSNPGPGSAIQDLRVLR